MPCRLVLVELAARCPPLSDMGPLRRLISPAIDLLALVLLVKVIFIMMNILCSSHLVLMYLCCLGMHVGFVRRISFKM